MSVIVGCCLDPTVSAVGHDADIIPGGCSQTLTYSFDATSDTPANMDIDSATGEITWCPECAEEENGPYTVVVKVEDNCGASTTTEFTATATNTAPEITAVEFTNEFMSYCCSPCWCVVIEDSKTLHIKVTAADLDDCQTLTYSLNTDASDPPLPPDGLTYEQVGDEFEIAFNANCYDKCIECDCWWEFIIRVTDGCETVDVCIRVCVADIINN